MNVYYIRAKGKIKPNLVYASSDTEAKEVFSSQYPKYKDKIEECSMITGSARVLW